MRILIVSSLYPPDIVGGAERVVEALAEGLTSKGHEVIVVCLSKTNGDIVEYRNGVKVYRLKLSNIYWPYGNVRQKSLKRSVWHFNDSYNISMAHKVGRILDYELPEIVHTHILAGLSVATWAEVKKRDIKLVHTLHDYYLLCPKTTMYKNGNNCIIQCRDCKLLSITRKKYSHLVDAIAGVSNFIARRHVSYGYFSGGKHYVVQNARTRGDEITSLSDFSGGSLRLGFLGRISQEKGFEFLLSVIQMLPDLDVHLIVAGRGSRDYEEYIHEKYPLKNVSYLGFVPPEELYKQIDILVTPSQWNDPFPTVIFEAYFFGVPVIGTRMGGIPEEIIDGVTGYLIDSEYDLLNILSSLSVSNLYELRKGALEYSNNFSITAYINKYLNIYERELGV